MPENDWLQIYFFLKVLAGAGAFLLLLFIAFYIFVKYHNWNFLKRKKKQNLRELCVKEYGEKFGELYDKSNKGIPIGGYLDTIIFLNKIEEVKKKYNIK